MSSVGFGKRSIFRNEMLVAESMRGCKWRMSSDEVKYKNHLAYLPKTIKICCVVPITNQDFPFMLCGWRESEVNYEPM